MSVTAGEIRSLLLGRLGAVLDRYCPGWVRRRSGGGVETAYLRPKDKRDLGSFQLHLNGPKAGGWVHYSAGQSGDIIDLIGYVTTGNARDRAAAFAEARDFLGLAAAAADSAPDAAMRRQRREREAARLAAAREAQAMAEALERQSAAAGAVGLWRGAAPAGPVVADYLAGRAIAGMALPPTLRFAGRVWHRESRQHLPAMIALVQDGASRAPVGVHITHLQPQADGSVTKAAVEPAKRMRGPVHGGHVRLGPVPDDGVLVIAEGIETALSVQCVSGLTTWAALSLGNLGAALPEGVHSVILAVDMDEALRQFTVAEARAQRKRHPEELVARAAAAHAGRGLEVRVARPPAGLDFNDWLIRLRDSEAA